MTTLRHVASTALVLLFAAPFAAGCKGGSAAPAGLCGEASGPLAGVAVLEVKDSPADMNEGVKFVKALEGEIAAECKAKGYEESAKEALDCYAKNKGAIGYRIFKSCPPEPGKTIVAAVTAKHGTK